MCFGKVIHQHITERYALHGTIPIIIIWEVWVKSTTNTGVIIHDRTSNIMLQQFKLETDITPTVEI